jgi:hypothetical protein
MAIKMALFALCLFVPQAAMEQTAPIQITNSDVISMTKAGIGEQTIIHAIQRGPDKFDISPQALIALKAAGVSDHVLDAMLSASRGENSEAKSPPTFRIGDISNPSERMAYENSIGQANPIAKEGYLEAFLQSYPQSVAKPTVVEMLAEIKRQAPTHTLPPQAQNPITILPQAQNPITIQMPPQTTTQGLTLRVLQEQSVPYTQESGGGISTSCNIDGTANTSAHVNSYGNSAYGNATTNSNQHMTCSSYDTTIRWPHVLNVMYAQASDGNSYIIACDRAWRWSKCVPLRAGDVFNARFTDKGIEVEAINTQGKEENPTYHILQSKSWR